MKETIKQRPLNRKKLLRRTIITASMAVIFGMIACVTFLLLEPVISNRLYPEEELQTVVFVEETGEDEISPEDMLTEDMLAEEAESSSEQTTPAALEDSQIEQVLSEINLESEDYGKGAIQEALLYVCENYQLEKNIIRNKIKRSRK